MPRKRSYPRKRVRKRRTYRRKRRVPRPILSGFPSSKVVKLRYIDQTISLNASSGILGVADHIFRANSVFDPDYSSSGHSPLGFSQWSTVYNKYTVLGSKINVQWTLSNTSTPIPGRFGIRLSKEASSTASTFSSINNLLESKLTGKTVRQIGMPYPAQAPYSGGQGISLYKKFSAKRFLGLTDVNDSDHASSLVTTNPSAPAYFTLWVASIDGNDPASYDFKVTIDYIVKFREPKALT